MAKTCSARHYCWQAVGRMKRYRCRRLGGPHIQAESRLRGFARTPSEPPYGEISMVNNARLFLGVPQLRVSRSAQIRLGPQADVAIVPNDACSIPKGDTGRVATYPAPWLVALTTKPTTRASSAQLASPPQATAPNFVRRRHTRSRGRRPSHEVQTQRAAPSDCSAHRRRPECYPTFRMSDIATAQQRRTSRST